MDNLEVINVQPNDCIVLRFDADKVDYNTNMKALEAARKAFPNNIVICFPEGISLQKFSDKEFLKQWIREIHDYIDKM